MEPEAYTGVLGSVLEPGMMDEHKWRPRSASSCPMCGSCEAGLPLKVPKACAPVRSGDEARSRASSSRGCRPRPLPLGSQGVPRRPRSQPQQLPKSSRGAKPRSSRGSGAPSPIPDPPQPRDDPIQLEQQLGRRTPASPEPHLQAGDVGETPSDEIDPEVAVKLESRLRKLAARDKDTIAWVIVEKCQNCHLHESNVWHDESKYIGKYLQLEGAIIHHFPSGISVASLAQSAMQKKASGNFSGGQQQQQLQGGSPRSGKSKMQIPRLGSFEVYLCARAPWEPVCGTRLPEGPPHPAESGRPALFSVVCVTSKLQSRKWHTVEAVLNRLAVFMPRVPLQVRVQTELETPISGAHVRAGPTFSDDSGDERPAAEQGSEISIAAGVTLENGLVQIHVPMCVNLWLEAHHDELMEPQRHELRVSVPHTRIEFYAGMVVQLWQMETDSELVIYCTAPTALHHTRPPRPGFVPFTGHIQTDSGDFRPDAKGLVRGWPDPNTFEEEKEGMLICCLGWRLSPVGNFDPWELHSTTRPIEVARLGMPLAEITLNTNCCGACVPNVRFFIDGEERGASGHNAEPLCCGVKAGDHMLRAHHLMLGPEGVQHPFTVNHETTMGVWGTLAAEHMRFVCVAPEGTRAGRHSGGLADLWVIAGDVDAWLQGRSAPPSSEVWLWDGDLCGPLVHDGTPKESTQKMQVRSGRLRSSDMEAANASHSVLERSMSRMPCCPLTCALSNPTSADSTWRMVLHTKENPHDCVLTRLARHAAGTETAMWLGRLQASGPRERETRSEGRDHTMGNIQLCIRSSCCGRGVADVKTQVCGDEIKLADERYPGTFIIGSQDISVMELSRSGGLDVSVTGVPPVLLPGSCSSFTVRAGADGHRPSRIDLDAALLLWAYWMPLEDDQDEDAGDDSGPHGVVMISANGDIPEEAQPLTGALLCPAAEDCEVPMDGNSCGPFKIRCAPVHDQAADCLVAGLHLRVKPPQGLTYRAKDPNPLAERCEELGGCELQRLWLAPLAMGFMEAKR